MALETVSNVIEVVKGCYDIAQEVKSFNQDSDTLAAQINVVQVVLGIAEETIQSPDSQNDYKNFIDTLKKLEVNVGEINNFLVELNDMMTCKKVINRADITAKFKHFNTLLTGLIPGLIIIFNLEQRNEAMKKIEELKDSIRDDIKVAIEECFRKEKMDQVGEDAADVPTPSTSTETPGEEERNLKFRDFLQSFSECFDGTKRRVLRFLLSDHLDFEDLAKKNATGETFFEDLEEKKKISSTDVNLLSEIATLTQNANAISCIEKYKNSISNPATSGGTSLSLHRKTLYRCLCQITENVSGEEQSDMHKLIQFYRLGRFNLENKWDVVFYLEKEEMLRSDKKDDLVRFAKCLNKRARNILQELSKN